MTRKVERYIRDGKVAVLVSGGFGAGWSTWNRYGDDLAIDARIIAHLLENYATEPETANLGSIELTYFIEDIDEDELRKFCASIGYEDVCTDGVCDDLHISWYPCGTEIHITEYDGAESISTNSNFTIL